MNTRIYRLWLTVLMTITGLVATEAQTLNLYKGDPAGNPEDAFDGNVFQAGNQFGDATLYAVLGGGATSFQIVSPGENKTATVTSTGGFSIRPTASMIVDRSKILNFSGTVTGSVAITVKPLTITMATANVTETPPGSEIIVSYLTGAGTFPVELVIGKFKVQLLNANGDLLNDLSNSADQYAGLEKAGSSRGGIRSIKATIPVNTPAGTYRVRVVPQGLTATVPSAASGTFFIRNNTPAVTAGSVSGTYCAGSTVSFPFSTTGTFPSGTNFKVQLVNVDGSTLQDLPGSSASSPVSASLPAALAAGTYRFRIAATATNVVSATSTISVSPLPTMTILGSATITAGATAPVQLTFTGTPPWSFTYTDNGATRATTSPVNSTIITPTFVSSTTYDRSFIKGFRDNGCGVSDNISGSAQISINQLTITTGIVSGTYCPGTTIPVSFTASSPLPAGAVSQVQLSDNMGSFQGAQIIGTGTSPISAMLPQEVAPGMGYRIRVVIQNNNSVNTIATNLQISRPDMPGVEDLSFCTGTTITNPLSATGINLKWYPSSSASQSLASAPVPPSNQASTYYVSQTVNGCESPRASINVRPTAAPAAPSVSSVSLCQGGQGQFSTSISGLSWYTAVTGGTPSAQTPAINNQSVGDQFFYVSQRINGCESLRTQVKATVFAIPLPPTVPAQSAVCQYSTPGSLTATGSTLTWYDQSGRLTGAPTPNTSTAGVRSFSVSQTVNGCESLRALVSVNVVAAPEPPTANSVSLCSGAATVPLNATGTNLKWYVTNTASQALVSAPIPSNSQSGEYYVSQTINGCESPRLSVTVSVIAAPPAPTVSSLSLCQGAQGQFSTTIPNALWYTSATGGIGSAQPPTPNNQTVGEQTVYVSQTVNGCESPRSPVKAAVYQIPKAPAVQTIRLCQNTISNPLTAAESALTWYDQSGKLTGAPTPSTSFTGTQSYSVSQTVDGCESSRAIVSVVVLPAPTPPVASSVRYCVADITQPLSATGTNLKWYTSETGGTASPTYPAFFTQTPNVYTFYVTQTDVNNCESARQSVSVTVVAAPSAPTVTATQAVCQSATVGQLIASPNTGLIWQGPGVTGNGEAAPIPNTSQPDTFTYSVSQKAGSCTSPPARIVFTVRPTPAKPTVQSTAIFCIGTAATPLSATPTDRLTWYTSSGAPLAQVIPNTSQANITDYYVTRKDEYNCESQPSAIQVRVSAKATARLTGDGNVNPGDSTAIRVRLTGDGPWTFTNWDGKPINTKDSLYVAWVHPTATRSYTITNLTSACGTGDPGTAYTLTVNGPLGTQSSVEPLSIKAYPNPTTGDIAIDWSSPTKQTVTLQIVNAAGTVVRQVTRQSTLTPQTEHFQLDIQPAGMYFLHVKTTTNGTLTKPIVKQ